jgi:peptide methionine sulfoxide reductase MsrA
VFGAAFAATLSSLLVSPARALDAEEAFEASAAARSLPSATPALGDLAAAAPGAEVYFGNGCFWGRQHEFVQTEREQLGRSNDQVSSLVGYAGGFSAKGTDGKVCYYYGSPDTVYERLGHGEVVRTVLSDSSPEQAQKDLRAFAKTYFANFKKIRGFGMQRLDPQDAGAGYRNMIGVPGGMSSPLMRIIEEENVNGMKLLEGAGNAPNVKPNEDDVFNAIWVYDSDALPFYAAEMYHQFHDGLGYRFPEEYTVELKKNAIARGLVKDTGCPEMRERRFAEFESITG